MTSQILKSNILSATEWNIKANDLAFPFPFLKENIYQNVGLISQKFSDL